MRAVPAVSDRSRVKPSSIAVVGNLCNMGYDFARGFSQLGVPSRLIVWDHGLSEWRRYAGLEADPVNDPYLHLITGKRFTRERNTLRALKQYDLILSLNLGGYHVLPFTRIPYASFANGSDLGELAMGAPGYSSIDVFFARRAFRRARVVFYSPDHYHRHAISQLALKHVIPWRQIIDVNFWQCKPVAGDDLVVFTPTSQHWIPQFEGQRVKRNDIFFKGFANFIRNGGSGLLRYQRRGPDWQRADQFITDMRLDEFVEPLEGSLSPARLRAELAGANAVANQFSLGILDLVTLEAMSAGRPVITFLDEEMVDLTYPDASERPPIRSAKTEEDVEAELWRLSDVSQRTIAGSEVARWVRRVHDPDLLFHWYLDHMIAS